MVDSLVFASGVFGYGTPISPLGFIKLSKGHGKNISEEPFLCPSHWGQRWACHLPDGTGQKLDQKMKSMPGTKSVYCQDMWAILGGQKWDAGRSERGKGRVGGGQVQVTKRRNWVVNSARDAQAKRLGQFLGLVVRRSLVNKGGGGFSVSVGAEDCKVGASK